MFSFMANTSGHFYKNFQGFTYCSVFKVLCCRFSDSLFTITQLVSFVNNFFQVFLKFFNFVFLKRRRRDLNPRAATNDLLPFQGSPFNHLGTSAIWLNHIPFGISYSILHREPILLSSVSHAGNGESGIRTHAPFRTNGFQDRLVMTTSISLQAFSQTCFIILFDKSLFVNHFFQVFSHFCMSHFVEEYMVYCCLFPHLHLV